MDGLDSGSVLLVGSMALAGLVGAGVMWLLQRRRTVAGPTGFAASRPATVAPTSPQGSQGGRSNRAPDPEGGAVETLAARLCGDVRALVAESVDGTGLWPALDQLLREDLAAPLGAARIRCYQVRPGSETLQPLTQSETSAASNPGVRAGVLGHVISTGREFVVGDPSHGDLLDRLAEEDDEHWDWIWPVRTGTATVGVVAVAQLRDPGRLTDGLRRAAGELISLCWQHIASVERLRVARRTDPASGVLTRNDFFALAGHALADSYQENEPVVVAVLTLEGLRYLDDTGRWGERDALIERLGQVIGRRVRSDDLVGRFADDRFVVLLRRLDSGLGRLIAEKLLVASTECIEQIGNASDRVRMRVGVVGTGFQQLSLSELLVNAFETVERARHENVALRSDLEGAGVEARQT
jgi:diguanylate cyclase (GGDEF)-like protein